MFHLAGQKYMLGPMPCRGEFPPLLTVILCGCHLISFYSDFAACGHEDDLRVPFCNQEIHYISTGIQDWHYRSYLPFGLIYSEILDNLFCIQAKSNPFKHNFYRFF